MKKKIKRKVEEGEKRIDILFLGYAESRCCAIVVVVGGQG